MRGQNLITSKALKGWLWAVRVFLTCLLLVCSIRVPAYSQVVPHEDTWGIYTLDLATEEVKLIYSSSIPVLLLQLNHAGDRFVFSQKLDGTTDQHEEICTLRADGTGFRRITNNIYWDIYPVWSPDDTRIAFLSFREDDFDIYIMNADGSGQEKLYDSGFHDADIHWEKSSIVFTSNHRIWKMNDDGTGVVQITEPPNGGVWGIAPLPLGDYDPRINPAGTKIVFERMVNVMSTHGDYDIYAANLDGSGETNLTNSGYTQGLANWSHAGDKIVYMVTVKEGRGVFDIYMIELNPKKRGIQRRSLHVFNESIDPTKIKVRNITPSYFPPEFLCHYPLFSMDDSKVFFVGQWWE